ncbi:hypothetical protein BDV3_000950 [Batrachochytrium dendrobatidis]
MGLSPMSAFKTFDSQKITVPPVLTSFVIFDSAKPFCEDAAGAAQQICFFYPPNTPLNAQLKQVGLLQAMASFTLTFPVSTPCEVICTRKTKSLMLQMEDRYWIYVKMRLGTRITVEANGRKLAEYLDNELPNNVLYSILSRSYARFKMFFKSFSHVSKTYTDSPALFKDVIDSFFSTYINSVSKIGSLDILSSLNGIHRLPLKKSLYLSIITAISEMESSFDFISKTCLFYGHHLLWSGLANTADTHTFYDYITDPETGKIYDGLVNQIKRKGEAIIDSKPIVLASHTTAISNSTFNPFFRATQSMQRAFSGFLVGPEHPYTSSIPIDIKKVYLDEDLKPFGLIVYQFQDDITFAIFVDLSDPVKARALLDPAIYTQLKSRFDQISMPLLEKLVSAYQDYTKNITESPEYSFKFITFNSLTLAVKLSINTTKLLSITSNLAVAIGQLNEDLASSKMGLNEIQMKVSKDTWIVATTHYGTRIFLVITYPDAKLDLISGK